MIDFSEIKLFKDKNGKMVTYEQLLQDIYSNSEESRETMKVLVDRLVNLVDSPAAAVAMMEHVNNLMDSKIKNDDLLVKVASILSRIIQRGMSTVESTEDYGISPEEKEQLLAEANAYLNDDVEESNTDIVIRDVMTTGDR